MSEEKTRKVYKARFTVDALHTLELIAQEEDIPWGLRHAVGLLHSVLMRTASIAAGLDDPALNKCMLLMHLYDVEDVNAEIDKQELRMKTKKEEVKS